jgi:hypothetical protein
MTTRLRKGAAREYFAAIAVGRRIDEIRNPRRVVPMSIPEPEEDEVPDGPLEIWPKR